MKTKIIEIHNGNQIDTFEVFKESGAETGDLIYDTTEKKFYPVYMLGNTNMCFEKEFQNKIFKVRFSTRIKDHLQFPHTL